MTPPQATCATAYWREFDHALRSMLGLAVVLGAALGAAITLTGARSPNAMESVQQPGACIMCPAPGAMPLLRSAPPHNPLKKDVR